MEAKAKKQPPKPEGETRRKSYNKVVRQARIVTITLEKIIFEVKPDVYFGDEGHAKREYSSSINDFHFDEKQGLCVSTISWSVRVKKKRKIAVKCVARYNVVYGNIRDCEEELVRTFVENVGQPATYSYFRGLYAHLDWSAELRSPPLPVVRFIPKV